MRILQVHQALHLYKGKVGQARGQGPPQHGDLGHCQEGQDHQQDMEANGQGHSTEPSP